jgi:TolB-like protein
VIPLLLALTLGAAEKPVVSVLYFENETNDAAYDVMRKGLAEMMVTDLVAWDGVTVVERARLEAVLGELSLQQTKAFDPATRVKVGKLLSAKYLITGSMFADGASGLRVEARIIDATTGTPVGSARAADQRDKIFDLEQRLVEQLTEQIDLKISRRPERRKAFVPSMSVLLAYSNGLELADQGKFAEADQVLSTLVSKNPMVTMARETRLTLLKRLEESKHRGLDITEASFVELGRRCDAVLPTLKDSATQDQRAGWLLVRSAVLSHALEKLVPGPRKDGKDEQGGTRLVPSADEPRATKLLEALFENELTLLTESGAGEREPQPKIVDPAVMVLLRDAHLSDDGTFRAGLQTMLHRVRQLLVDGRTSSGTFFPTIAALQPRRVDDFLGLVARQTTAARRRCDAQAPERRKAFEYEVMSLMTARAETLEELDRDEEAAVAWQAILDAFPTSAGSQPERHIKIIAGVEHDSHRSDVEKWSDGLRTCDDMSLRIGLRSSRRYDRMGFAGLDALTAEVEKACLGRPGSDSTWDYIYGHLASFAAEHQDCARAKALFLKQFSWGVGPRSFEHPVRAWPECNFGFEEATFPTKVRVVNVGLEGRADLALRHAFEALPEALAEELGARGIAVESGGASHGGVGAIVPRFDEKTRVLTLEYRPESNGPTVVGSVTVADAIDVTAVLAPVLAAMRPGADRGPRKASAVLPLAYLTAYGEALAKSKHREGQDAFEAVAKAWPQFRLPPVRAKMAAARAEKEHH